MDAFTPQPKDGQHRVHLYCCCGHKKTGNEHRSPPACGEYHPGENTKRRKRAHVSLPVSRDYSTDERRMSSAPASAIERSCDRSRREHMAVRWMRAWSRKSCRPCCARALANVTSSSYGTPPPGDELRRRVRVLTSTICSDILLQKFRSYELRGGGEHVTQQELSVPEIRRRAAAQGIIVSERTVHNWFTEGKIKTSRLDQHGSRVWRFATVDEVDRFLATLRSSEPTIEGATSRPSNTSRLAAC
jgi:hypothetical protein